MQIPNPFELIISRLDQLQQSLDSLHKKVESLSQADTNPDKFLTLAEAAELVRKPTGTVRYYIHNRNLPATKVGKSYLVKKNELLKWLEEFTKEADAKVNIMDRMLANRKRYRKSHI